MIAYDKSSEMGTYLSEKIWVPLVGGAIPLYSGNGDSILANNWHYSHEKYLTRFDFASEDAFVDEVLNLLRDIPRMERMKKTPIFTGDVGIKVCKFWQDGPLKTGEFGFYDLFQYLRKSEAFGEARKKKTQ